MQWRQLILGSPWNWLGIESFRKAACGFAVGLRGASVHAAKCRESGAEEDSREIPLSRHLTPPAAFPFAQGRFIPLVVNVLAFSLFLLHSC